MSILELREDAPDMRLALLYPAAASHISVLLSELTEGSPPFSRKLEWAAHSMWKLLILVSVTSELFRRYVCERFLLHFMRVLLASWFLETALLHVYMYVYVPPGGSVSEENLTAEALRY